MGDRARRDGSPVVSAAVALRAGLGPASGQHGGGAVKNHRIMAMVTAIALVVAGCSSAPPAPAGSPGAGGVTTGGTLAAIKQRGVLKVGAECLYKGTCFYDPETNTRLGYGVDLTDMLARDLGVTVEWVDLEWTALIPAVQTGQVDMVTMGMTKTPERSLSVYMSDAMDYYPVGLVLHKDDPLNAEEDLSTVLAELNEPGKTITFLLGGAHEIIVDANFPNAEKKGLDSAQAFEEVASGRAQAMVVDTADAWDYSQNNANAVIWQDRSISNHHGSFVLRYGDDEFLNYLNNWLEYYRANGTLRGMKLAWNTERGIPTELAGLPPAE